MRKLRIVLNFLGVIFLLAMVWTVVLFTQGMNSKSSNSNSKYIPDNAESVVTINGESLILESIEEIILKAEDDLLLTTVLNQISSESKDQEGKGLGIDIASDIVVFTIIDNTSRYVGVLLNLSDPKDFKKNASRLLDDNSKAAIKGDVGLILMEKPNSSDFDNSNSLQAKCDAILRHPSVRKTKKQNESTLIHLEKGPTHIDCSVEGNNLLIEGTVRGLADIQPSIPEIIGMRELKPTKGVHLSSIVIPQELNDSIQSRFGDSIPELQGLSVNLTEIDLVSLSMGIVPMMDTYFDFKDSISLHNIVQRLASANVIQDLGDDSFTYKSIVFHYQQIQSDIIYVGCTPYSEKLLQKIPQLMTFSGDLGAISHIKGESIVLRWLEIIPMYASFKSFAESTEFVDFSLVGGNDIAKLKGNLQFKKEHFPIQEILRFVLNGQFLK